VCAVYMYYVWVYDYSSGLFRRINELMENYHSKAHIKPYLAYEKHECKMYNQNFLCYIPKIDVWFNISIALLLFTSTSFVGTNTKWFTENLCKHA